MTEGFTNLFHFFGTLAAAALVWIWWEEHREKLTRKRSRQNGKR